MDFEIPEDLTALKGEDLAATLAGARAAAKAVNSIDDDEFTDEHLAKLEALTDLIEKLEAAQGAEAEAAEKRAAARAKAASLTAEPEPEEEAEEADADEEEDEEVEAEDASETPADEEAEEKVLITASGNTKKEKARVVKRAAAAVTAPEIPNRVAPVITAAADAPAAGYSMGATLKDLDEVTKGAMERFQAMPRGKVGNVQNRYGVAHITKQRTDGLSIDNFRSVQDLVQAASVESRLPGGSLTAAGGWCAPSETIYDLCSIESTDGLWDLPEVQVNRGGIQFTKGPTFEDFYAYAVTAFQTETEAEAGTVKTCIPVECPEFEEVRLDAAYVCISAGILTNAAYPELIRRYIEGVLIAQRHAVSARLIAAAEAITGPAIPVDDVWPNALSLLHTLELVAEGERERFRMARSATLEVLLPYWVRPALRADLANRTGVDLVNVSDSTLDSYFANRGLRVQWLYNYQPLDVDTNGIATDYPDTLETIMYPAGTFVMLTDDVIRLDAVYDSTGLETNTYTALFAEEGVALANVCHDPRRLSIDFAVTGLTAAALINQDFGEEPPAVEAPEVVEG
jgi:hypothetical protein